MKKILISALSALAASLLCVTAFAASDFEKTYFPNGTIATPEAPYLVYFPGDIFSDTINMWYTPSAELRTLGAAVERQEMSDIGYEETFGICGHNVSMQTDIKIDDGDWQYTSAWDDREWSGVEDVNNLVFRSYVHPDTDQRFEQLYLSDLHYIEDGETAFLTPAVVKAQNEYGDDVWRFDLNGHTVYVRYRYAVSVETEYGVFSDMIFSDWSPVTSIGKNGTQQPHTAPTSLAAPVLSEFSVSVTEDGWTNGNYYVDFPDSLYDALLYCEADQDAFEPMYLQSQMRINGGEWQDVYTANPTWLFAGYRSAAPDGDNLNADDTVEVRTCVISDFLGMTSEWSNIVGTKTFDASEWALPYMAEADSLGLIPECLVGEDLTRQISRKEFAAVCVKLYESLSGTAAAPVAVNPFTDCDDAEVLKALNVGVTAGTSDTTFEPDVILNREQAATMLTRVFKKVTFDGWTLATDANYNAQFAAMFEKGEAFADDADIDDWAKDSVYFMKANGIIGGIGGNLFAPKHGTTAGEAEDYGLATREQALKIAVGMVQNLG